MGYERDARHSFFLFEKKIRQGRKPAFIPGLSSALLLEEINASRASLAYFDLVTYTLRMQTGLDFEPFIDVIEALTSLIFDHIV